MSISANRRAPGALTGIAFDPQLYYPVGMQPAGRGERGAVTCRSDRGAVFAKLLARRFIIDPSSENI